MAPSRLIVIGVGLSVANFLYQALNDYQWSLAIDRSFFQIIALVAVYVAGAFSEPLINPTAHKHD